MCFPPLFRLVRLDEEGFIKFDITLAVAEWLAYGHSNKGVEVWVESVSSGRRAAKVARRIDFADSHSSDINHRPALAVFFKENKNRDRR